MPGDCRDMLRTLPEGSVDSCVTDPPYEINFMNRGFDRTGIAFDPDFWRMVFRVLKPGAHLCAFASPRKYHRLACAIEDAGFEIRDQIDWIYGSGMPHGADAARMIDGHLGVERRVVGRYSARGVGYRSGGGFGLSATNGGEARTEWDITVATSPEARQWDGWNTELKPAHEPIVLARKPLEGSLAENLIGHGAGALHVDACRVPFRDGDDRRMASRSGVAVRNNRIYNPSRPTPPYSSDARFPPDILLSDDVAEGLEADAGRFFPVFRYEPKAGAGERPSVDGILHPTVKPVGLMRWLVRLVTPVGGLVAEPFAGSGATLEACVREGMRCVSAEMDPDYVRLIRARMDADMQTTLV